MTRLALPTLLAGRFLRTKPLRQASAIVLVTAATLTGLYVALVALSQTGERVVQRDLGRFEGRADLGDASLPPGETGALVRSVAAIRGAGATDAIGLLESMDVQPIGAKVARAVFREADWAALPFPDRYGLDRGRWPTRPGEVAVSATVAERAVEASGTLRVLSGNASLRVVGEILDRFASSAPVILAAPGTWRSLDAAKLAEKYPNLEASTTVLWSGIAQDRVVGALTPRAPAEQSGPNLRTRAGELATDRRDWVDRLPIAYRVPSIALTVLAVLATFALNGKQTRRNLGVLRAVGVPARDAVFAVVLAGSAICLLATVAGIALGALAGLAITPLLEWASTRPLAPYPSLAEHAARLLATVAATCVGVAGVMLARTRRVSPRSLMSASVPARSASTARHLLATAAGAYVVWQLVTLDDFDSTIALVAGLATTMALMTPELVRFVVERLPARDPRGRLARRQMLADSGRVSIVVGLLTLALGPASAMSVVLATASASDEADRLSLAAPGQITLIGSSPLASPDPALVERVMAATRPASAPIQIYYLESKREYAGLPGSPGTLIAVETSAAAARLSNGTLTPAQERSLRTGALLAWSGGDATRELLLSTTAGAQRLVRVPVAVGTFQPNWEQKIGGLILTGTARRLGLPLTPTEVVLTGVGADGARQAERSSEAAGYDSALVQTHQAPSPARLPPALLAAALGLAVLVVIATAALARAQAAALRQYLAGLLAIGAPGAWARGVLRAQLSIMLTISIALSLIVGLMPLFAASIMVEGTVLAIPWAELAAIALAVLGSAYATSAWASSGLKPADRRLR